MSDPKAPSTGERPGGTITSRFTPYSDASPRASGAAGTRPGDVATARPFSTSERPPWLVFEVALGLAAILVVGYGATTRSWTLLMIEALIGTASLSVGCLLGFLFGIPRVIRPRNAEASSAGDSRRDTANIPYEPSNNLEQVADWLTKILVGVGLVEFGKFGTALAQVGEQVAKSVAPAPAGTTIITEVILVAFVTIGFLASFLWTRIYYGGIQARADTDIVNWLQSKLEDQESRIERADKVAEKLASGKLIAPSAAPAAPGTVAVTAELPLSTTEMAAIASELPPALQAQVDRFLHTGVDWEDDTVPRIFGKLPSEANGRVLRGEISVSYEQALVIRLVVERRGGAPLTDDVAFLLHPTFHSRVRVVPVDGDDRADLDIYCTGWFTVGAIADKGQTLLEYDLRTLPGLPDWFKTR